MGKHINKKYSMKWFAAIAAVIMLVIGGSIAGITSTASATEAIEQVCKPLDSGKIDTSGDPATVPVTAPEGFLISGYCVKAGSANQGDGPEYVTLVTPVASITFGHSSGKAVSHYSASYVEIVEPPVIIDSFVPPTAVDNCGLENDVLTIPADTDEVQYNVTSDTRIDGGVGTVTIDVVAVSDKVIAEGVKTHFEFYFDNQPCITIIEVQPQGPTFEDYCGTANDKTIIPADTDQLDYSEAVLGDDGVTRVTVSGKNGVEIDGKLQTTFEYTFTDVKCPVVVPPTEPPVVVPPVVKPPVVVPPTTPPVSVPVTDPKTENVLYDAKTDGAMYAAEGNNFGAITASLMLLALVLATAILPARKRKLGVNRS
jgi:hypothetical protein